MGSVLPVQGSSYPNPNPSDRPTDTQVPSFPLVVPWGSGPELQLSDSVTLIHHYWSFYTNKFSTNNSWVIHGLERQVQQEPTVFRSSNNKISSE